MGKVDGSAGVHCRACGPTCCWAVYVLTLIDRRTAGLSPRLAGWFSPRLQHHSAPNAGGGAAAGWLLRSVMVPPQPAAARKVSEVGVGGDTQSIPHRRDRLDGQPGPSSNPPHDKLLMKNGPHTAY